MGAFKRIVAFFASFAIVLSFYPTAKAADVVYRSDVDFWTWAGNHSFFPVAKIIEVAFNDAFCHKSDSGQHYAESYLSEFFTSEDGEILLRYDCICEYCGEVFSATPEALYADYVSGVGRDSISSDDLAPGDTCLYNGVELPVLPDDDYSSYAIFSSDSVDYFAYKVDSNSYFSKYTSSSHALFTVNRRSDVSIRFYRYVIRDNKWVQSWSSGSSSGGTVSDGVGSGMNQHYVEVIWSGTDIVDSGDNSTYFNGSVPVPVGGAEDNGDRIGTYMEDLEAHNQNNPYQNNPYTPNYYITPDNGTSLYSPAVFSESKMVFTEPKTGNQYLCTDWTYHYSEDSALTLNGITYEGTYLGSYVLKLADNSYVVDGTSIPAVWILYHDENVMIFPIYRDEESGTIKTVGYSIYSYAAVAQTECGLGAHEMIWEVTQPPTCSSSGTQTGTCSICGDIQTYQLDPLPHTYQSSVTQQPTCATSGIMTYTCSGCGNEYMEQIAATGIHSYEYSVDQEPSCTTEGVSLYTCSTCGNQYTEPIAKLEHDWIGTEVSDDGVTSYTCSNCGATKIGDDATEVTQESWFIDFVAKFNWLTAVSTIYKQLVADVTSDAATAAAVADGTVALMDVTSGHAATNTYTAPELAISFGTSDKYGVDWANIKPLDLSWYAPHKETVDGILSGILWLSYLFLLIKRAPGIIRGSEMVTEDRIKIDNWRSRH